MLHFFNPFSQCGIILILTYVFIRWNSKTLSIHYSSEEDEMILFFITTGGINMYKIIFFLLFFFFIIVFFSGGEGRKFSK